MLKGATICLILAVAKESILIFATAETNQEVECTNKLCIPNSYDKSQPPNVTQMLLVVSAIFGKPILTKVDDHEFSLTLHVGMKLLWKDSRLHVNSDLLKAGIFFARLKPN